MTFSGQTAFLFCQGEKPLPVWLPARLKALQNESFPVLRRFGTELIRSCFGLETAMGEQFPVVERRGR